jgi:hypothetical protein
MLVSPRMMPVAAEDHRPTGDSEAQVLALSFTGGLLGAAVTRM